VGGRTIDAEPALWPKRTLAGELAELERSQLERPSTRRLGRLVLLRADTTPRLDVSPEEKADTVWAEGARGRKA